MKIDKKTNSAIESFVRQYVSNVVDLLDGEHPNSVTKNEFMRIKQTARDIAAEEYPDINAYLVARLTKPDGTRGIGPVENNDQSIGQIILYRMSMAIKDSFSHKLRRESSHLETEPDPIEQDSDTKTTIIAIYRTMVEKTDLIPPDDIVAILLGKKEQTAGVTSARRKVRKEGYKIEPVKPGDIIVNGQKVESDNGYMWWAVTERPHDVKKVINGLSRDELVAVIMTAIQSGKVTLQG